MKSFLERMKCMWPKTFFLNKTLIYLLNSYLPCLFILYILSFLFFYFHMKQRVYEYSYRKANPRTIQSKKWLLAKFTFNKHKPFIAFCNSSIQRWGKRKKIQTFFFLQNWTVKKNVEKTLSGLVWFGLVVWFLWYIKPCKLFNARFIFMQIVSSILNNPV